MKEMLRIHVDGGRRLGDRGRITVKGFARGCDEQNLPAELPVSSEDSVLHCYHTDRFSVNARNVFPISYMFDIIMITTSKRTVCHDKNSPRALRRGAICEHDSRPISGLQLVLKLKKASLCLNSTRHHKSTLGNRHQLGNTMQNIIYDNGLFGILVRPISTGCVHRRLRRPLDVHPWKFRRKAPLTLKCGS